MNSYKSPPGRFLRLCQAKKAKAFSPLYYIPPKSPLQPGNCRFHLSLGSPLRPPTKTLSSASSPIKTLSCSRIESRPPPSELEGCGGNITKFVLLTLATLLVLPLIIQPIQRQICSVPCYQPSLYSKLSSYQEQNKVAHQKLNLDSRANGETCQEECQWVAYRKLVILYEEFYQKTWSISRNKPDSTRN